MATVPIEIVLQDAETPVDPTPTPESGEETNIVVPNTGTISNDGSSNGGIGSAISIILPIVIIVLALGAMVTLLVRRQQKRKKVNNGTEECNTKVTKKEKLAMAATSTVAVLAVTVLIGNLVIPATKAATSDIADGITPTEDKVSIVVTRDGGSAEASIESTATITSTSDFGYKVLLSMAEGVETNNLYLDGNVDSDYYISATESTELSDNTWGYTLEEDGEYAAVPLVDNAVTIAQGDEPVEDEALSIYYGVKVSSDLPAGTYSGGEIEYNLVSLEPSDISELTYMQDFAKLSESAKTSVLRSMAEGKQYILKDDRDKKEYFISKLADSNVWMTQNLDLDIEAGRTYTSADTDLANSTISTSWTPTVSTSTTSSWISSDTAPSSYDPGNLYWNGTVTTSGGDLNTNTVSDPSTTSGGTHYHVGNYYNWTAAVAMNDSSSYTTDQQDVNQSICPAGWRLPTYEGDKSFDNLVSSQNLTVGPDGNMHTSSVYFVYGGADWHGGDKEYFYIGDRGLYLTSAINDEGRKFGMYFYYSNFTGWSMNTHYNSFTVSQGNTVRCVAR